MAAPVGLYRCGCMVLKLDTATGWWRACEVCTSVLCRACVQEVFPEADGAGGGGDDMMLLSFEEFKAIVEDYDVSRPRTQFTAWGGESHPNCWGLGVQHRAVKRRCAAATFSAYGTKHSQHVYCFLTACAGGGMEGEAGCPPPARVWQPLNSGRC